MPAHDYSGYMEAPLFLSGQLLLAMPGMGDPRFDRAVIAVCLHDENGALGVGIGTPLEGISLHGLLRQLDLETTHVADRPVLFGGPVEAQRGFVLHSRDWGGEDTIEVTGRWSMTGTLDVLREISEGRGPKHWLVALGYAGWGAGQLDAEMTRHGWFPAEATDDLLFETPIEQRWIKAFAQSGVDIRLLSATPGRA